MVFRREIVMKKALTLMAIVLIVFSLLSMLSSPLFAGTVVSKAEPNSTHGNHPQAVSGDGNSTLASMPVQSGANNPMQSVSISVPYHSQITNYYCGEAALEMVFNYYGADISQYEIADVARAQSGPGTYTDDIVRAGQFSNLSTSVGNDAPGYECTGYTGRTLGYGAFQYWFTNQSNCLSQLRALVDQGYPIIVLTWFDSSHTTGHYRVVIGYDSGGIIAQDPWNGPSQYYSNSVFMDLWSYNDYWGMFTAPWSVSINSPSNMALNSTFQVSANITYTCPNPFDQYGDYPASSCNATIQLPSGFSLASGQTATKAIPNWFLCGESRVVSWNVVASSTVGSYAFSVLADGLVQGSVSSHGPYPAYQYTDRIGGVQSTNITVKPVHLVTFMQSGLSSDANGTVLIVNSTADGYANLPFRIWVVDGGVLNYSYSTAVTSTILGKRFILMNVTGPSSPINVTTNITVSGNFKTQYSVTFAQSGLDSSANSTVVTVNGNPEVLGVLQYTFWVDNGSSVTYTYTAPVSSSVSNKQFKLTSVTGPTSPITVNSATILTGNYAIQYYLTVTSPYGTPGGQGWYDNGTTAYASLNTGSVDQGNSTRHVFTGWSGDSSGANYAQSNPVTMNGAKTATANWKTQYQVTFQYTELDSSASSTVVIVNGSPEAFNNLPYSVWVDSGSAVTYSYSNVSSSTTGKRFILVSVSGLPSPVTITNPAAIIGNYKTQYQVTFAQSGVGSDFIGNIVTIDGNGYGFGALPTFWLDSGSTHVFTYYSPLVVSLGKQYAWSSTTGLTGLQNGTLTITNTGNVTGNYITQLTYYRVTFTESGLPSGTNWWVSLDSNNKSSTTNVINFSMPNGTYTYITGASGYTASPSTGSVTVNSSDVSKQVTFIVIPEFPSFLFLPLFLILTLLAVAIYRKKLSKT